MTQVHGVCDERFGRVREELARNFGERGEVGASVAVTYRGEPVVDLWGGTADPATGRPWERDTVVVVLSSTKGATSLCAHLLAAAGELDFDAPVARYWPEFAAAGKAEVRVRHLLSHQAGLPALREPLPEGAFYDWDLMTARLAAEEPFWEPGTGHGYHAFTFGFLVGEVIRRVAGTTVGEFFAKEVAEPLGLDFWIGLPESEEHRVAPLVFPPPNPPGVPSDAWIARAMSEPGSLPHLVLFNTGGYTTPGGTDGRAAHAAQLPAMGGITNARSLAALYAPLAGDGVIGGHRLGRPEITRMGAVVSAASRDAVMLAGGRWTLGFQKAMASPAGVEPPYGVVLSEAAFGHPGSGGSIGFADPEAGLSFGFAMNNQIRSVGITNAQPLIDAVYTSLGYETRKYGFWA